MSLFNGQRLDNSTFKLDLERLRKGWYSDKYFTNIATMLTQLAREGYTYSGQHPRLPAGITANEVECGDIEVEMQWFTRRPGTVVVAGIDKALTILKEATGYFEGDTFFNTAHNLKVWAVQDGAKVEYDGDIRKIQPVMRVRGRYRDFAILETSTLGILARSSRVATNVFEALIASKGKQMLFFPARFDVDEVQAADGYAYQIAVQRYNYDHASTLGAQVSTDAQGDWWDGTGGGTISHSAIASFLGDTSEAMLNFARVLPASIPRIALVDFTNDSVGVSLKVCRAMFDEWFRLTQSGDSETAKRFVLRGIRLDTGSNMRDVSVERLGDPLLDHGVNPRLVFNVRYALDNAAETWDLPKEAREAARKYCRSVRIVVSGGFNPEKIAKFERLQVPVDTYAVGSYFFDNHERTNTDFTADVVRVRIDEEWVDMAKVGRHAAENPELEQVW
ncbi:MAG: nicotinate phosphoribosyltransferase [Anaerolineaceae bacterium]